MASKTLIRTRALQALCGMTVCATAAACSGDVATTDPDSNPWGLNEWSLIDPGTGPMDMDVDARPELDLGPIERDLGMPLPVDMEVFPIDFGQPDSGTLDLGEPDFGEPDFGEPDLGPMLATTGSPCNSGADCTGGRCLPERNGWQDGYCSQRACEQTQCVATGGDCIKDDVINNDTFCAQSCNPDPLPGFSSCREGYECRTSDGDLDGATYCLPPAEEPPPEGVADGEACVGPQDCQGGTCITESEGWPAGYCTTSNCNNRRDCATPGGEDNRCYQNPQGPNICVRICQDTSECRQDYICQPVGGGQGFCVPDPTTPVDIDFSTYPIPVTCGPSSNPAQQSHTVNFNVSPTSTSYMITTLAKDGRQIAAERTDAPSGNSISYFQGAHGYQNTTAQLFGFVSPIPTPGKPEFATDIEPGMHQHTIYSESQDVCHYFLEESTPGTTIDLNIYLVGVPGITAAQGPIDPNLQQTLTAFSNIYASTGITVGTIRYFDLSAADEQQYRIIRSDSAFEELVALSSLPGNTADDALSMNVFFVQSIVLGGTLGISQGLPGPAGIHGTRASGVVFTSEYLGQSFNDGTGIVNGNDYTGIVLAHEVGHYLGLFHTTEQGAQSQDPLTDTPACSRNQFPNNCPDLGNLMFPFADISHTDVTPHQSYVIGVNPLTKD